MTKGNNTWILPALSADPLAVEASRINPQMGQVPSHREKCSAIWIYNTFNPGWPFLDIIAPLQNGIF